MARDESGNGSPQGTTKRSCKKKHGHPKKRKRKKCR
jgi:hypothetical protein